MAGQVVQMDYGVVTDVSKGFQTSAEVLTVVGKVLEGVVATLKATAFASGGTSLALALYYENIQKKVNVVAKLCNEFSRDLSRAVQDHKNGDVGGKQYFGEGVQH